MILVFVVGRNNSRGAAWLLWLAGSVGFLLLVSQTPLRAQEEYYIPRRAEQIEERGWKFGLRSRFRTSGGARRDLELVPRIHYTPFSRLELSVEIPLIYARQPGASGETTKTGTGDLFVQGRSVLTAGSDWRLVATLEGVVATGDNPIENEIGLGDGFDRVTPGLTYIRFTDPLVLFVHAGYEFPFEETYFVDPQRSAPQNLQELLQIIFFGPQGLVQQFPGRHDFKPGEAFMLQGGTSILLNPTTKLSFFGALAVRNETEVDGEPVSGSQSDAVQFGTGLDVDLSQRMTLSTNFSFGISDQSDDLALSTGLTYSY